MRICWYVRRVYAIFICVGKRCGGRGVGDDVVFGVNIQLIMACGVVILYNLTAPSACVCLFFHIRAAGIDFS